MILETGKTDFLKLKLYNLEDKYDLQDRFQTNQWTELKDYVVVQYPLYRFCFIPLPG